MCVCVSVRMLVCVCTTGLFGSSGGFQADGEDQPNAVAGATRQYGGVPGGGKRYAVVTGGVVWW